MKNTKIATMILAGSLLAATASAEPVVKAGGKPGAAKAWSSAGGKVILKIASDYDADAVATAIRAKIPGVTATVSGEEVTVGGIDQAQLLVRLEEVDVAPLTDDVDAMLAAMKDPGAEDEGSGSSIRATQAADFSEVMGDESELVQGKVVKVKRARFPLVFVTVKVTSSPKALKGIKKGKQITVLPRVKSKNGVVDPDDQASKLNVGAWYAQPGDTVRVRLEELQDDVWVAKAFERKAPK